MMYTVTAFAFVLIPVWIGSWLWHRKRIEEEAEVAADRSGWVYFVAAEGNDMPVKIGMTSKEPSVSRIPELSTLSPVPLRIIYKVFTIDRYALEAALHRVLEPYRQHGEWFERDAALAWADHLRSIEREQT